RIMKRRTIGQCAFALLLAAGARAQEVPIILEVEVENRVNYVDDVIDPSKVAQSPVPVTPNPAANFAGVIIFADVTAINGNPAKGVMAARNQRLTLTRTPIPGQAISDVVRGVYSQISYEFLKPDGSPVGMIFAMGLAGAPSPGSPTG